MPKETKENLIYPRVGIGVMVLKDSKVLMSVRKTEHGYGEYQSPGGHLELGESFEDCARREVREETGLEIDNIRFQFLANIQKYGGLQYVHVGLIAHWKSGEPQVLEPEKSEGWEWYDFENLPTPQFETSRLSFESFNSGQDYFDL